MNSKFAKVEKNDNCSEISKSSPKDLIQKPLPMSELIKYGYRLLEYVREDYLYIFFGLTAVITNSITNLTFPWLIGQAVDRAAKGQNPQQLKSYLISTSAVLVLGSLASWIRVYCLGISHQGIVTRMKQALYQSYLEQDLEFFDESQCGELITVLDKDIELASQVYTDILTSTLRSMNSAINGSILLYLNSPKLCGVTLLSVPIVGIGAMVMAINSSRHSTALREIYSSSLSHTIEKLNNITTIKINGKELYELEAFKSTLQQCYRSAQSMFSAQGAFMSYLNFTTNGCLILVLYVGGTMLGTGEITSGNLTTFAIQSGFVGLGYSGLSTAYSELREALNACYRFYQSLDDKSIRQSRKMLTIDATNNNNNTVQEDSSSMATTTTTTAAASESLISLRDVHYSYPTRPDHLVLQNITMSFQIQSIQIIIGKSGSGKSTLLSLLCGLYSPTIGEITTNTTRLCLDWVHEHIGVVEQAAKLFSGTIRENICYGSLREVSQTEIEEVAKSVNAHEFISSLPDGYGTQVGEGGQMLSGGQRARVALARALIKDPEILILDEPSASLDTESEEILIQLLLNDAIMSIADQLFLIDHGSIITSGTYDDLMKNCQSEREIAILRAVSSSGSLKSSTNLL